MRVVRADDTDLKNAFTGTAGSVKIKSTEHYNQLGYDNNAITNVTFAARNPGSWGNGIRVATIDGLADQIIGINTAGIGFANTNTAPPSSMIGVGVTQTIPLGTTLVGAGSTSSLDGYLKGIVTQELGNNKFGVKVVSHVSAAGTETNVDYTESGIYRFRVGFNTVGSSTTLSTGSIGIHTITAATNTSVGYAGTIASAIDWFGEQTLTLTGAGSTITWNSIVDKPGTSSYAAARNSRFDEVHVVVIDGDGEVTGNSGTILEKHISLSLSLIHI